MNQEMISYLSTCYDELDALNKELFNNGVKFAKEKVCTRFPNYRKNIYLNGIGKNFYLKYFNAFFADLIYYLEKNKMN